MYQPSFQDINWILTGLAIALSIGRYAIRGYNSRRLYWDDLAHLLALLVLISHGVTEQLSLRTKATLKAARNAEPRASDARLLDLYGQNWTLNTVTNCSLHAVFWLVKISFLLLYRLLFNTSATFKKVWWGVLAFTILTFWVPIGGVLATCAGANTLPDYEYCNKNNPGRITKLEYSCAVNVVTDLAIMALPWWMLKNLKVNKFQKTGLAFVFSVALFCVALDITRTIQAIAHKQAIYTILEKNLVVVVSCLPTYRSLAGICKRHKSRRTAGSSAWRSLEDGSSRGREQRKGYPLHSMSVNGVRPGDNVVHIKEDIDILNERSDESRVSCLEAPGPPYRPAGIPPAHAIAFS